MRGQGTWMMVWRTCRKREGKGEWESEMKPKEKGESEGSFEEKTAVMGCQHNRENGSRSAPRRKKV